MFAVFAEDFSGSSFSSMGDTLENTWENLLSEHDLTEDDIDMDTVNWFEHIEGIHQETVTRWVYSDFV